MLMINNIKQFVEEIDLIKGKGTSDSQVLYRGHVNSSWKVESSLERVGIEEMSCEEYYRYIDKLKPLINPLIATKFIRKMTELGYPFKFDEYESGSWSLPEMEYLTYLRHHGFPTPLIDWTESQYIALFFACEDFVNTEKNGKVFVYSEKINGTISGNNIPGLRRIGKYVETHRRHFAQQSQYLVPMIYDKIWNFITFKRVMEDSTNSYKFNEIEIATEAKREIIKELRIMNINRYTMFLDEDSLVKNFADEFSIEK